MTWKLPLILPFLLSSMIFAKNAKQQVSVGFDSEPRAYDPRYAVDANAQYLMDLTQCALISFNEDGQITPSLADSYKWTSDKVITFKLKKGIRFSDGSTVSPADVKATYDFFKKTNTKNPSPLAGAFQRIAQIDVKGDDVTFTLSEPDSSFAQNFMVGILPKALAEGDMLISSSAHIGCGPFTLVKADLNGITLQKNEKYNIGPVATLDHIDIKIVKDEQTRYAKLRKGELDLVQNGISRDKISELAKTAPQLRVQKRARLDTTYLGFNIRDRILANVKVRQAIAHAINRTQIIDFVLKGMAAPATTLLMPNDPFVNKDLKDVSFDVTAAKKLLDDAGLKDPDGDGKQPRFEISYKTTTDTTRITIAQAIASQLAKIGIKVKVESLEWGKFKADIEKGQVQMWSLSWVGFKDPDIYRHAFASESFPPNGGNRGWYSNKALDEILTKARTTTDLEKRKNYYKDVQKIVAEEMPYVFLWHEEAFAVINKDIKDFTMYADGRLSALSKASRR